MTYINKFKDECRRTFVWSTSTNSFSIAEKVKLKGTIKNHSVYNDEKQTILTRCKVLD